MKILFYIIGCLIIYTMIGYPVLLEVLSKILKPKNIKIDYNYEPSVTIIIPAHNEENVIENKILNLLNQNYPQEKIEIIIASDNSTDSTNNIVSKYDLDTEVNVSLYIVKSRKGKTNAQDEAVQNSQGEVIIFTDANSMLEKNAVTEIVRTLSDKSIAYVAGKLIYTNSQNSSTSESESSYWNIDLRMRKIESDLSSITAGNGSIYGVRKVDYIEIDPIYSHDSVFPPKYVTLGKRAVYNENAIAFEKAGETNQDEFSRKIRMSRKIIGINFLDISKYNIFKYGLFSLFYISHRTFRNNLYLFHILLVVINICLILNPFSIFFLSIFIFQVLIYFLAFIGKNSKNRYIKFISYYIMTILAQLIGSVKELTGQSKPFWEKAETTR